MSLKDRLLKLFNISPKVQQQVSQGQVRQSAMITPLMAMLSLDGFQQELYRKPLTRLERFTEYDIMDLENGDIGYALDLYADECLQPLNTKGDVFFVSCKDKEALKEAQRFVKKFNLSEKLWGYTRALAKYGEVFFWLDIDEEEGIKKCIPVHPRLVDPVYVQGSGESNFLEFAGWKSLFLEQLAGKGNYVFTPYELLQWRISDFDSVTVEGRSMLANSVKAWRMLDMLEVMVQLFRMNRAIEKRIYNIDVGNADLSQAMEIVLEYYKNMRQMTFNQVSSGEWVKTRKPSDFLEEIFFPKRSDSDSSIEIVTAPGGISDIVDVEYFKNKLRLSLGIPSGYFDEKEAGGWDKGKYLSYQDMKFAKRILRLQNAVRTGVRRLIKIHLKAKNLPANISVSFSGVSVFEAKLKAEMLKDTIEVVKNLVDLAGDMGWDKEVWGKWLIKEYLNIPANLLENLTKKEEQEETEEGGSQGKGTSEIPSEIEMQSPEGEGKSEEENKGEELGYVVGKKVPREEIETETEVISPEEAREDIEKLLTKWRSYLEKTGLSGKEAEEQVLKVRERWLKKK